MVKKGAVKERDHLTLHSFSAVTTWNVNKGRENAQTFSTLLVGGGVNKKTAEQTTIDEHEDGKKKRERGWMHASS